jgi:hypothetical protein
MPTALRFPGIRPFAALIGLCALLLGPAPAWAQDAAAIDKVTKLNKRAVDEYQNLNFDEARKLLKDALDAAGEAGLDAHRSARTHVPVVRWPASKQKDEAIVVPQGPDIQRTSSSTSPWPTRIQEAPTRR